MIIGGLKMKKGMIGYNHIINGMSLLYDYHWTLDLIRQVKEELNKAIELIKEHPNSEKCICGDSEQDIHFYFEMLVEIENAVIKEDLSAIPWVQERLHSYMIYKYNQHHCISELINSNQGWILECNL
jgi:hypothetical protein